FEPAQTLLTDFGALEWSVTAVPGPPAELPTLWAAATLGSSLFPLRYVAADRQVEVLLPQSINTSYAITDLVTADLNGDGTHDLVVLDANGGWKLHALFGPDFKTQVFTSAPLTLPTSRLAVSDLFGDGHDKVVFVTQADAANSGVWVMGYQ